jgi:uncharacterized surface protein with fasciclin (FAS1) repeats
MSGAEVRRRIATSTAGRETRRHGADTEPDTVRCTALIHPPAEDPAMSEQPSFLTQQRWTIAAMLVIALGPLTALTFGSKYADEETLRRAEAGDRNYDQPGPYASYQPPEAVGEAADSTVLDITSHSALFERFQQAIDKAGMSDVLSEDGPFTLFVPTNEAFADLPADTRQGLMQDPQALVDLVSNHVVLGRLAATDLIRSESAETLSGESLALTSRGQLSAGNAEIIQSNLVAGNGIVHIIDRVFL